MKLFKEVISIFLILTVYSLVFTGCGDSRRPDDSLRAKNQQLQKENQQLQKENRQLRTENQQLQKEKAEAQSNAKSRYVILSVIAYVALGIAILLISGFVLVLRKSKQIPSNISNDSIKHLK